MAKLSGRLGLIGVCAAVVVGGGLAMGQGAVPQRVVQEEAAGQEAKAEERRDLRFDGGTVAEYAAAVRKVSPTMNIVLGPGAGEQMVPAMELLQVRAADTAEVLATLRHQLGNTMFNVDRRAAFTAVSANWGGPETAHGTTPFSLAKHLRSGFKEDAILSVIRTSLDSDAVGLHLKYHPETSLLIVRGSQEQRKLVERTLDRIMETAESSFYADWHDNLTRVLERQSEAMAAIDGLQRRIAALEEAQAKAGGR